jgi:hypothetical protein
MARQKPMGRTALALLIICLLAGAGGTGVWAGDGPGVQLVLVLDFSRPTKDKYLAEAVSLLVHLPQDQDYLGLVGSGEPDGVLLPTARLSPEHRHQALKLALVPPASNQKPLNEVMQQALDAFQPQGPQRRVLFWLGSGVGGFDDRENPDLSPQTEKIATQARSAGVTIFAALMGPADHAGVWQTLTSISGGRVWEVESASDLVASCLKLYRYLDQPQEALIQGSQVRLDRWVKEAVMVMARAAGEKEVVLISPAKARITKRTRHKTVRWVAGHTYDLITLTRPRPGVWSFTGARSEVSRVFLSTELMLTAAETPREAGADEALHITAALHHTKGTPVDPELEAGTQFQAELLLNDIRLAAVLKKPSPDESPTLSPGARIGRFPPLHEVGDGTLRLVARGKDFQRLRSLPLSITQPWYRVTPPAQEAQDKFPLRFQPNPGRRPEHVEGALTLKAAPGGLSGVLISPAPGAEIVLAQSPGHDFCWADLRLRGTAPDGRPLNIASGPVRLQTPPKDSDAPDQARVHPGAEERVQRENPWSLTQKFRRRWIWLALCAVGGGIILVAAFLLWRLRTEAAGSDDEEGYGGASPQSVLRLKAQVENLTKEKSELEAALQEKTKQFKQLQAEKAELQTDLERLQKKSQANIRTLGELEKKLAAAEQETQGMKQEYMALYARNQREKEVLKKN